MPEDHIIEFTGAHNDWMTKLPTTDEEAIQFLHYGKNPRLYVTIDALYKRYREHARMDIIEAVKKVLQWYVGEEPS